MGRITEFLSELRKRHVYRIAVAYAVVAWVVMQATALVVPELSLPGWITRLVIVLALLGFPVALLLAWAYDISARGRRVFAGVTVTVLVVGAGLGAYAVGSGDERLPRGEELIATLVTLADEARYVDAFALAARAAEAGEVVPDSIVLRFTDLLTVLSDPAGARVRALRAAPDADPAGDGWLELGTTPLRGVAVPRGDYLLRIEAGGHAPVERMASSERGRSWLRGRMAAEVLLEVPLLPRDQVPEGMVHVPGGLYRVASRELQSLSTHLADYFIDRHEVTNAAFAAFIDAGGYTRRDVWTDLERDFGGAANDVLSGLVDRTGLPAPRSWTGQRPPSGLEQHPVTGVSWYEAAAYCRFRGGHLPTLFEWEKAARDGQAAVGQGIELPWGYIGARDPAASRANFSGTGTAAVGSYPFGVSAWGAYDMAGNVKEWLRNRSEAGRAATGGSYEDPIYVFSEVGSRDPLGTSPSLGFRCARPAPGASRPADDEGDRPLRLAVQAPVYPRIDAGALRLLLAHYDYDRRESDGVVEARVDAPAWTLERIRYTGPAGDTVLAYLFLPKNSRPPFQTMVYVPHSGAFYGFNLVEQAEEMLGPLVRGGRAVFTVVMAGMTERSFPPDWQWPATNSVAFRDLMVRHATELRMGLDYLATRTDIDGSALAYVGVSWGAGSRLVFAATDERFRAAVLIGAGIDERVQPTLPEASNINFAPYIRVPKLVVNGREDEEHPWVTRALPLWNLLSEPKELTLFDGVGHLPPAELRVPAIRDFLDRLFGPPVR